MVAVDQRWAGPFRVSQQRRGRPAARSNARLGEVSTVVTRARRITRRMLERLLFVEIGVAVLVRRGAALVDPAVSPGGPGKSHGLRNPGLAQNLAAVVEVVAERGCRGVQGEARPCARAG